MEDKPKLISFKICPFVQRSVIAMLEKQVEFDIEYIELDTPPDWFLAISPFGKVPVLQVGDTAIFESAVICEYLDEVYAPRLHPDDVLTKAYNRSWIEFASDMTMNQYMLCIATDADGYQEKLQSIKDNLQKLEARVKGDYFNGDRFSLVDAVYAPVFMRYAVLEKQKSMDLYTDTPKIKHWSETLLQRDSVKDSVVPEFEELFLDYFKKHDSYLLQA